MANEVGGAGWAALQQRIVADVEGALKRKSAAEARLVGAARVLAPMSPPVRGALATAAAKLSRRAGFQRELYGGSVRSLAELGDDRCTSVLCDAIASDEAGGLATLSAACFSRAPELRGALNRAASARQAHVCFAAEVARSARGDDGCAHLAALAPKIKESHRISLCIDVFLPLVRGPQLPSGVAPALAVLRGAERHLGRWLIMAELATLAGDPEPLEEARERSSVGPQSSRAAWSMVAWALDPTAEISPRARPTAELVARLSDRPSADRDTRFLFRLGSAHVPSARVLLETLVRTKPLADEVAVRAAGCLLRGYGRDDMREVLEQTATTCPRDDVRGVAAAALWDAGFDDVATRCAGELLGSKTPGSKMPGSKMLSAQVWGALILRAKQNPNGDLLDETRFRRLQWGWLQ